MNRLYQKEARIGIAVMSNQGICLLSKESTDQRTPEANNQFINLSEEGICLRAKESMNQILRHQESTSNRY